MVRVSYEAVVDRFESVLLASGLTHLRAHTLAVVLADNTRDGVASHGVNRFAQLVGKIRSGEAAADAVPERIGGDGGFERWDGHGGIGPLNALEAMDRAIDLAGIHGVGVVALRNTTHWMRGASYGYRAAERGCAGICWTNTGANMTPWGSTVEALGNNPIVFAMPGVTRHVVLDMALCQYSYGSLQTMKAEGRTLSFPGGFDRSGVLSTDPQEIIESRRVLPIGLWKGSGLSLLVDLFASVLSDGTSTEFMPEEGPRICQTFITFHLGHSEQERTERMGYVERVLDRLKAACTAAGEQARYPGEGTAERRAESMEHGIAVREEVWQEVLSL